MAQFPDCYEAAVIKMVHYATLKEEDLSQRVVSYFKDRFVAGEVVLGRREGKQAQCTVVAALDPACATHDCALQSVMYRGGVSGWMGHLFGGSKGACSPNQKEY